MNVDRHYETFACFCSLTLFVSSCPTNSFFPLPKVILDAPHLSFQQLLRSHVWVLCFPASPPGCCTPTLPQLNLHNTRPPQPRAASFKSLYRKRAFPPCSCPHFAYSRFRYSTKTYRDLIFLCFGTLESIRGNQRQARSAATQD